MTRIQLLLATAALILIALYACTAGSTATAANVTAMQTYPTDDYDELWAQVDSLERLRQPKSGLAVVDRILTKARAEDNPSQTLKALLYREKYQLGLEEESYAKTLTDLEAELQKAKHPVKPLLYSMLAELYDSYAERNRWEFGDRTETTDFTNGDIKTWTLAQLQDRAADYHLRAVSSPNIKSVSLASFEPILTGIKDGDDAYLDLQPTLYDLLLRRAIKYFTDDRSYLSQPAARFYLEDAAAFAPIAEFTKATFSTPDSTSGQYRVIGMLQDALAYHSRRSSATATHRYNMERLEFVREKSVHPDKDSLYLDALTAYFATLPDAKDPASDAYDRRAEVNARIAKYWQAKGNSYTEGTDSAEQQFYLKRAREIAMRYTEGDSRGAILNEHTVNEIERRTLQVQAEAYVAADKPALFRVEYRNQTKIYTRLIAWSLEDDETIDRMSETNRIKLLTEKPVLAEASYTLRDPGDYREHSTEIMTEGRPYGMYALVVSDNPDFEVGKNGIVTYTAFQVTDLAMFMRPTEPGQPDKFYVVDRTTGEPQEGVTLEYFKREYSRNSRQREYKRFSMAQTDANGFAKGPNQDGWYSVRLSRGADKLISEEQMHSRYSKGREEGNVSYRTVFFMDRMLYRPGQTIYFKGLVLESRPDQKHPTIATDKAVTVTLYDANRQKQGEVELRSNQYGTVSGTFTAPESGMLGYMTLRAQPSGSIGFRVEEYKRPKFEVTFEPVTGSYQLGQQVEVEGQAKAFAGNNIDGATVNYRVVRKARYPYWWRWWIPRPQSPQMEIAQGTTTTDAEGKFEVAFEAIPDRSIDPASKPVFEYEVIATVVDITGETHESTQRVSVGYQGILLDAALPERIDLTAFDSLAISSRNLNGTPIPVEGTVQFIPLVAPDQAYIERLWAAPDQPIISRARFNEAFPMLPYQQEDRMSEWGQARKLIRTPFETKGDERISTKSLSLTPGAYLVVVKARNAEGEEVEYRRYVTLYRPTDTQPPYPMMHWVGAGKTTLEPGEQASLTVGTSAKPIHAWVERLDESGIRSAEWMTYSGLKTHTMDIREADRGGVAISAIYYRHGRAFAHCQTYAVPYTNKQLQIEYASFRDKLQPGAEETWRLTLKGPNGEKVGAEMVAALYDASLDQITGSPNSFALDLYSSRNYFGHPAAKTVTWNRSSSIGSYDVKYRILPQYRYPQLHWFGFPVGGYYGYSGMMKREFAQEETMMMDSAAPMAAAPPPPPVANEKSSTALGLISTEADSDFVDSEPNSSPSYVVSDDPDLSGITARTNLDETVFFYPHLMTDAEGNIAIEFTMNEALTRWKFLALAHTTDLKVGTTEREIVTQKELMVQPNAPRFFREGDKITYTAKVSNLTDKAMNGTAQLMLFDAVTMQPIDDKLGLRKAQVSFTAPAGQSAPLSWELTVPRGMLVPVAHRMVAKAGQYSDGEEDVLPILTNRTLITETMPLPVKPRETKDFTFTAMQKAGRSSTLTHHGFTLEYTSNPAWYAVQSLPYLMEYPYECSEQILNRFYANALATSVANKYPRVKRVFEQWRNSDAMLSNLSKNQELKSALLAETPWVLQAQSEEEQKRNIGLLFDLNRMAREQETTLRKLTERQQGNGGFPWMPGGRDSWYITQYIVENMGHLDRLGVTELRQNATARKLIQESVAYIDSRLIEHYEELKKQVTRNNTKLEDDHLSAMAVHYLYARSFYLKDYPITGELEKVVDYYTSQATKYWAKRNNYQQGMIALALDRMGENAKGDASVPQLIVKSLRERSITHPELGMYWKYETGYYWYQLPMETHSLMIELFSEVAKDENSVNELKIWLLKRKQTTHWKTTKATAAAVYALLMTGDDWLLENNSPLITVGDMTIDPTKQRVGSNSTGMEAGTGYFKRSWAGDKIKADWQDITVKNNNNVVAWGAAYWQYFEDFDKVEAFEDTPLKIVKQLFVVENSPTGEQLRPIDSDGVRLQPGDKLKVRIELRVDRDMEYVHMKDHRASGFEPINVLSRYQWQGRLGYYESTRDTSTDFFFGYLPKGTHVFEYPLRVIHEGDFSNGITTVQCMYAPEFTSHSEGVRVKVE